MLESEDAYQPILCTRDRRVCGEFRLVLEAVGIPCEIRQQTNGEWELFVEKRHRAEAEMELAAYQSEEHAEEQQHADLPWRGFRGAFEGVFGYVALLCLFAIASWSPDSGEFWQSIGHMDAGLVVGGQWWRTVTALTLHLDGIHLLSNLGFGAVFGYLAGQILGGGVAWLTIVLAGGLGNLLNAYFRDATHVSIGASTAVFAALGIMVAHAVRPVSYLPIGKMERWSPLAGGLLLLAFMGTGGERTDVGAHVAGFVAGLTLGLATARLPRLFLESRTAQITAGTLAFALVLVAWVVAGWAARP